MAGINSWQIKRIHILKSALKMDDETYRTMLGGFSKVENKITSSKQLSYGNAYRLINEMTDLAKKSGAWKDFKKKEKYSELDGRPGMASSKQLRMLEAMWKDVSIFTRPKARQTAFMNFTNRIVKVEDITWIEIWMVEKLVKALVGMGANKPEER